MGIILDQFYNPSPITAHDSVLYIMTRVQLGNCIRSLHYWAATVVFITVFMHLAYVFWCRSYARPRELYTRPGADILILKEKQYNFITKKLLVSPPNILLEKPRSRWRTPR